MNADATPRSDLVGRGAGERVGPAGSAEPNPFHAHVAAALTGDAEAVEALFVWIRPLVVRYCRTRIGRTSTGFGTADDVAQEVCLAVLGALSRYTDDPKNLLPFVYGIAAHKVADYHRRLGRDRSDPSSDVPDQVAAEPDPEEQALAEDLRQRLWAMLSHLTARQRDVVLLRVVVGLSAEEVGEALGMKQSTVRSVQHAALQKLRKLTYNEIL